MLKELSPTVIPEQNPPASAKTSYTNLYKLQATRLPKTTVDWVLENDYALIPFAYAFSSFLQLNFPSAWLHLAQPVAASQATA